MSLTTQHIEPTFHSDETPTDYRGRGEGGAGSTSSLIFYSCNTDFWLENKQNQSTCCCCLKSLKKKETLLNKEFQREVFTMKKIKKKKKNVMYNLSYKSLMHLLLKVGQDFSAVDKAVQRRVIIYQTAQQRGRNRSAFIYLSEPSL